LTWGVLTEIKALDAILPDPCASKTLGVDHDHEWHSVSDLGVGGRGHLRRRARLLLAGLIPRGRFNPTNYSSRPQEQLLEGLKLG
jgi:hypothetical protein